MRPVAFYRYYQTKERGVDTTPILVRQTVPTLDSKGWSNTEAFVNGKWIDGNMWFTGIFVNGNGTAVRVRTPPGQPDSPDSSTS